MYILATIVIGLIIGIVARLLMPGKSPSGFILTTLLGIGGAVIAKFIGQAFGWYSDGQPVGFIASVLGAMLLLFLYHLVERNRV